MMSFGITDECRGYTIFHAIDDNNGGKVWDLYYISMDIPHIIHMGIILSLEIRMAPVCSHDIFVNGALDTLPKFFIFCLAHG